MSIDTNDDTQLLAYFAGEALNALLVRATSAPSDSGTAEQAMTYAKAMRDAFRKEHPRANSW
jgi:hypothetical protein